jgi:hypothetical protein
MMQNSSASLTNIPALLKLNLMPQEALLAVCPVLPIEIIRSIFERAAEEPSAIPRLALVSHQV